MVEKKVIIIGAGPVGLFVALRLTQLGIPVKILEKETDAPPVPRALGYFGASMFALERAGIWEEVKSGGPTFGALGWRKLATEAPDGSKDWGEEIAFWNLADGSPYEEGKPGWGMTIMGQHHLKDIILPRVLKSGLAEIDYGYGLTRLHQDENGVTIEATNEEGDTKTLTAAFVVAADGGKSTTRKQLGIELEGFTWPEIIISNDVELNIETPPRTGVNYIIAPKDWCFFCPLTYPNPNGPTPYRVTFPMTEEECKPEVFDINVKRKFETVVPGPRPLTYKILRQQPYRIHQRLASSMVQGRVCLAGDAAHLNSVSCLPSRSLKTAVALVLNYRSVAALGRSRLDDGAPRCRVPRRRVGLCHQQKQISRCTTDMVRCSKKRLFHGYESYLDKEQAEVLRPKSGHGGARRPFH